MKTKIYLLGIVLMMITGIGFISFSTLFLGSEKVKKSIFEPQPETYKSETENTKAQLVLNPSDSTYSYDENSILKPGDDVTYHYESKGKFSQNKDEIILTSEMPSNQHLRSDIINLSDAEIRNNRFSYIYPLKESIPNQQIKIYFDNIAEIADYQAYTFLDQELKPLKIFERKELETPININTDQDHFFLFHYITVEKPAHHQLIITTDQLSSNSMSYLFDLSKIPSQVFHFYTRAYASYRDFTGLRFKKTKNILRKVNDANDQRYIDHGILRNEFVKD